MGISGSLQDFSLPEIFQIINNGSKSGRLSINSILKDEELTPQVLEEQDFQRGEANSEGVVLRKPQNIKSSQLPHKPSVDILPDGFNNQGTNYLWFQNGNFVAISNSDRQNSLINLIKKENFLSSQNLVKLLSIEGNLDTSMGDYCLKNALLNFNQIDRLFEHQLEIVYSLFELENGWFVFEDANKHSQVSEYQENFSLKEMTGKKLEALTILLQAMRSLKKLNTRLKEQIPDPNSGLIQLTERLHFKLLPVEACLFDNANGQSPLKKLAQKNLFEIKDVQEAALRLILSGLVEEIPVTKTISTCLEDKIVLPSEINTVSLKEKNQVRNSFLGNLVNLLRNSF
jgi:hypothetical protein